jgi:hypothetical protein
MMKQNRSISVGWQGVILALAGLLYGLLGPAYCQDIASAEWQPRTDATVLLMQQPDSRAGSVTPDVGVHHFDLDSEVLLTAAPKPSYYFVYWIGDVSDPTAISTLIYMDAPKIILAVFARSEFAFSLDETMMLGGGGGGGLRPSAADYSNQGYTGGGSKRPPSPPPSPPPTPPPTPPPSDEFPVPPPADEFPVPTPEPATVLLLGLGSLLLVRRRTKR